MGTAFPPDNQANVKQWYDAYNGHIDGIFLDIGPTAGTGTSTQSYYQYLYNQITANYSGSCGSGRACVMLNASQFEQSWVQQVSDYTVLWEHPLDDGQGQNYLTNFIPASTQQSPEGWYFDPTTADRHAHVVYSTPAANMDQVICQHWSYGTPMLYVFDGTSQAYNHLPSYYEAMINDLQGCPVNPPCGVIMSDACGNQCSIGNYCAPRTGICQDCGGYDCCR
jgi:hypothetical protein